jgi:hypothetical protein
MTEKKTQVITINDKDYTEDQLTDNQKIMVNHVGDLDRKINSTKFNLDQLSVGKQAFIDMLTADLAKGAEEVAEVLEEEDNVSWPEPSQDLG